MKQKSTRSCSAPVKRPTWLQDFAHIQEVLRPVLLHTLQFTIFSSDKGWIFQPYARHRP